MLRAALSLVVAFLAIAQTQSATITGTVRAQGKPEAEKEASGGNYTSRRYKFAERVKYDQLRDFVVYISQSVPNSPPPPSKPIQVITQKDATFAPHVLPVMVGTTVEWPNYDDIYHNVFSMSETKPFDLGLYKDPEIKRVVFDKPGRVDVFCSIHTKMNCIILVLPNPYFAVANAQGRYSIPQVPPGAYKLQAWHERLPSQTVEVIVPEEGSAQVDFTLGIVELPKY